MGYYTLQLAEESHALTTFIISWGKCQFKRMPFELSVALDSFQYCMDKQFTDLGFVKVYLDNILILLKSMEQHLEHLKIVLKQLA